jgi:hypothetical protein
MTTSSGGIEADNSRNISSTRRLLPKNLA